MPNNTGLRTALLTIAERIAATDERLRLARNEDDASQTPAPDAATFLKLDGRRIGRDIEVYAFMEQVAGAGESLACFAIEIVLPLQKTLPKSYAVAADEMRELGRTWLPPSALSQWLDIFEDPAERNPASAGT